MNSLPEILSTEGFSRIGEVRHELDLTVWWHAGARVQLLALDLGDAVLLRGSKAYYLTTVAEEGETWARDISALHDHLEAHFPELHLSFSFLRDVPAFLAARQARSRRGRPLRSQASTTTATAEDVKRALGLARQSLDSTQRLRHLDGGGSSLLTSHLVAQESKCRAQVEALRRLAAALSGEEHELQHLQREYRDKGSAACLVFSLASNLQLAATEQDIRDASGSIVKELSDSDRYQVKQKLSGGKLRVGVAEATEPALVWIEQWFGGLLNPTQLSGLGERYRPVVETLTAHVAITPDEDIKSEGECLDHRKLLAPRVVSSMLQRLDNEERNGNSNEAAATDGASVCLGLRVVDGKATSEQFEPPLRQLGHVFVSGMTGSGKSVGLRVLCEEAARDETLRVLIIDPRNQAAGILLPQDQPDLLARFPQFGNEAPRGFPFGYFSPTNPAIPSLPSDLGSLAESRTVVSLKGLSDEERCRWFRRILEAAFERISRSETASIQLLVVVEEAHLITERLVAPGARPEAQRAVAALDRVLREGRKFGVCAVVSSQSIKDFARDAASIRQNTNTKVFFHNSDREIEYARDFLDDPRALTRLRPGLGIICNPALGNVTVAFRPPLSKVWDLSDTETATVVRGGTESRLIISVEAERLHACVLAIMERTGSPPNATEVASETGITSKRRLQELLSELTATGLVTTRRLSTHGRPRVIEPRGFEQSLGPRTKEVASPDGTGQEVRDAQ